MQTFFPVHACALRCDYIGLERALQQGVRFSKQDAHGNLLLHCAVASGNLQCVRLVLDAGANVMLPNRTGSTALRVHVRVWEKIVCYLSAHRQVSATSIACLESMALYRTTCIPSIFAGEVVSMETTTFQLIS